EIDERCEGFAIRQQGFPVEMGKYVLADAEAVRPDQSTVFFDAPTVCYMAANDLLAVGGTTQHEPLEGQQLRSGRQLNFRLAAEASPIEHDCFLREPTDVRDLERLQPCPHSPALLQRL